MAGDARKVLVTAGATGIGRAVAEKFANAGASVAICDIDPVALEAIRRARPDIAAFHADVAVEPDVERLVAEATGRLNGLDLLVNNAGIAGPTAAIEAVDLGEWQRCLDVNLTAAFLCCKHVVPIFKRQGFGLIVNIASTAGQFGYPQRAAYACAKWALIGLTKTLAMELGPHGIRVNAIAPGPVEGPRMDRVIAAESADSGQSEAEIRAAYARSNSLGTFINATEIADTIHFLASQSASKINGHVLNVDGHTEYISL